jgi:hypothetical protein
VPNILEGLKSAPIKKLIMVSGGENPIGDPCEARHFHGFIGIEKSTVELKKFTINRNPTISS